MNKLILLLVVSMQACFSNKLDSPIQNYIKVNDIEYWGSERIKYDGIDSNHVYIYQLPYFITGGLCKLKMFPVDVSSNLVRPLVQDIINIEMGYFSEFSTECASNTWNSYFEIIGDVSNSELFEIKQIIDSQNNRESSSIISIAGVSFESREKLFSIELASSEGDFKYVIEISDGKIIR